MKRLFLLIALVAMAISSCSKQESMDELKARVFERAAVQVKIMDSALDSIANLKPGTPIYPRNITSKGKLGTANYKWWCTGFYPGTLWYVYEYTKDESFKDLALKYQAGLEPLRFRTDDHDIGFQLMSSFGHCLRLTGDQTCVPVLIDGAKSLGSRFNPKVGCTRSWNHGKWSFPVIVDNMMNLELLLKANELGGPDSLKTIAITHANTTLKNHYRDDFSSFHLVDYDPETGEIIKRGTVQGFADDSAWSRGQSWGLYGYTMMYRYTKDQTYLNHAIAIAEYLIPRLPADYIPFWDYDATTLPDDVRDASSASIMASALIELSSFVDDEKAERYMKVAENQLRALASDEYLMAEGEGYGFLLKHSTGHRLADSEVDVPLTYADYYFLEALHRWK